MTAFRYSLEHWKSIISVTYTDFWYWWISERGLKLLTVSIKIFSQYYPRFINLSRTLNRSRWCTSVTTKITQFNIRDFPSARIFASETKLCIDVAVSPSLSGHSVSKSQRVMWIIDCAWIIEYYWLKQNGFNWCIKKVGRSDISLRGMRYIFFLMDMSLQTFSRAYRWNIFIFNVQTIF